MAQNNNQGNGNISFSDIYEEFKKANLDMKVEIIKRIPDKEMRERLAKEYSKIQAKNLACDVLEKIAPGLGSVAEMSCDLFNF